MALADHGIEAGGAMPPATVRVWDPFVRLFHWSLVLLFGLAYVTGDEVESLHLAAGYGIAALLVLRVVWGLIGSRYARFGSFVRPPHEIAGYLRDAVLMKARRHLGHNPAGGAMILTLLAMLSATIITGAMMTTDAFWGAAWVETVHATLAAATVGLIVLHVLGVIMASLQHRENLVAAMITGRKRSSKKGGDM